jgi:DNA-binding MarR family transcriptional regulator
MSDKINEKDSIQKDLAQELVQTLAQFKRIGSQHHSSKNGIKPSEFIVLHLLLQPSNEDSKGLKVSEISEMLHITPSAVTHTINSLEKGGYIERHSDPSDRRIVLVRATTQSKEVMEQLRTEHIQFIEGLVAFMGEKDSKDFIRLLSTALEYFRKRKSNEK